MSVSGEGRQGGFSLVELVIVVVIIGIIAAIAVPRLSRGSAGAAGSALEYNLQVLRQAIDTYTVEHQGRLPSAGLIEAQLTAYTDLQGNVSASLTNQHIYGPYLREIPPLPSGNRQGASRIAAADGIGVGWLYDEATGEIQANAAAAIINNVAAE